MRKHWADSGFSHDYPQMLASPGGKKYVRVYSHGDQDICHSFVRRSDGAVLKSAGWKAPDTKHVRSNIYDADHGRSGVEWTGAKYL